MTTSTPGGLRGFVVDRPEGGRLVFVPRLPIYALKWFAVLLVVPAVGTSPLVLFGVLPVAGVIGGFSALWPTTLVCLVLLLAAGIVAATVGAYDAITETVRWVELRPNAAPATLVLRQGLYSRDIPLGNLRRVAVVQRYKLGVLLDVRVVLETGLSSIDGEFDPAKRATQPVDAAALAAWLSERLTPAGIEVERETVQVPASPGVEHWWPAWKVAAMWGVPVERVAEIANEHGVRSQGLALRYGARVRLGHDRPPLYSPDDVWRLAQERRATGDQRSATP